MKKANKKILKMQYLKKFPIGTIAEIEQFIKIIKNQKQFNKSVSLFKKDCLLLFKNNKNKFNDVCFMSKFTSLQI